MTKHKRPFIRRGAVLFDSFSRPSGEKCTYEVPAVVLGEGPTRAQKAELLTTLAKRTGEGTAFALHNERSPDHLKALLAALRAGDRSVPGSLTKYVDDARVRPALLAAAKKAEPGSASNHIQSIGYTGGPGVKQFLRGRVRHLLQDSRTFLDDPFFNDFAGEMSTTASALLRLDADELAAAEALVRLFDHPCGFNRRRAVSEAMQHEQANLHGSIQTAALRRLRTALRGLSKTRDDRIFLCAFPTLLQTTPSPILKRARRLLKSANDETRRSMANVLVGLPAYKGGLPLLAEWAATETDLRAMLQPLLVVPFLVPEARRIGLVARALADESPSLRFQVLRVLRELPVSKRKMLAAKAVLNETDPALRTLLARLAKTGSPLASRRSVR